MEEKDLKTIIQKPLAGRVNAGQNEFIIDYMLDEVGDNVYTRVGNPINVYKFRQVSGYTIFTKSGEIPKFQNINTAEQFANFKTGKEPITIVWEGSSSLKNSIEQPNVNKYNFKVGTYEECYSVGSYGNEIESIEKEVFGADFVVDLKSTNIQLESPTWIPNNEDQINYFYIIVDKRYPSYQILQLKEYETYYNEKSGDFVKTNLTFENINLKYSSTGRQILDFVQFGSIGFGYAFPKEIINENNKVEVILDETKLTNIGVQSIQLDTNTVSGLQSIEVFGSPINNEDNVYNQTQRLFLLNSILPEKSDLFYNDQQMNYYFLENAKPKYKSYIESYQKNPENPLTSLGSYNVGNEKKILGGLFIPKSKVIATNTISSTTGKYTHSINSNDEWIKLETNYFLNDYNNNCQDLLASTADPVIMKTTDFLNFNAFVNFYIDQFSYEIENIIKWKLTDTVGFLGGLVNFIVGGIDIGWTSNKTLILAQPMNLLIPTNAFEMSTAIFPNVDDQPIPLELFNDNKDQSLLPTDNKQLCSFHFSLTDYIKDTSNVIEGAAIGKGGNGIWNTKYLGQKEDENFITLFSDNRIFKYNPRTTKAIPNPFDSNQKYIIDAMNIKQVYSGDMRITAFVKDVDIFTNEFYNRSIYSSILSSTAKMSGKFRITSSFINFNYWNEFNTIGSVPNTWPELLPNPAPTPITDFIWLNDIKAGSPLVENKTFKAGTKILSSQITMNIVNQDKEMNLFSEYLMIGAPQNKITLKRNLKSEIASDCSASIIYEKNPALYDTLYSKAPVRCGQINNLSAFYEFNILKYTDEQLSKFDRLAINFRNQLGNLVWARITGIDFVALKNEFYRKSSTASPTEIINNFDYINTYIKFSSAPNPKPKSVSFSFEKNGIKQKRKIPAWYGKEFNNFIFTVEHENGKTFLSIGSGVYETVKFVEPVSTPEDIAVIDATRAQYIFANFYDEADWLVKDYSQLKIVRVILFEKDFDETNDITYIN